MIMKMSRRQFHKLAATAPLASSLGNWRTGEEQGITRVPGIRVGHWTSSARPTGCTVVIAERPAAAGVDVRGSAPGTRETDLLKPINTVSEVDAVLLSGGSAFGLDAATGVMRYLEEHGRGFNVGVARVPIVPAAILFDLGLGDAAIRPDAKSGYAACANASGKKVAEGNVGAGAGATVGKLLGSDRGMKGGLGSSSIEVPGGLIVGALAAVNCLGDVRDPETGTILAGARRKDNSGFEDLRRVLSSRNLKPPESAGRNTTLVVVATNASFDKTAMTKVAQMCHDGFARAIDPVHLPFDGDTAFALSTGQLEDFDLTQVGALAAEVTAQAITRAILNATSIAGYPAHQDFLDQPIR